MWSIKRATPTPFRSEDGCDRLGAARALSGRLSRLLQRRPRATVRACMGPQATFTNLTKLLSYGILPESCLPPLLTLLLVPAAKLGCVCWPKADVGPGLELPALR